MVLIKRYEPSDNLFKKWGELFAKETLALSKLSHDEIDAFQMREKNNESSNDSRRPTSHREKVAKKNNAK